MKRSIRPRLHCCLTAPVVMAALLVAGLAPAQAQLRVLAVAPEPEDLRATAQAHIQASFDRPLDEGSLSFNVFRVWGNFHGAYEGLISYLPETHTLRFIPAQSFIEGEEITVVLRNAVRGQDGSFLARPLLWRFVVGTHQGTATFLARAIDLRPTGAREPAQIIPADFNNDGFVDLAIVHRGADQITLLPNRYRDTRGGQLTGTAVALATQVTPARAAAGDFNADGRLDLAVVNFNSNTLQLFFGNGDLGFSPPLTIPAGEHPNDLHAQDLDGDGDLDLALLLSGSDRLSVLRNDGSGRFAESQRLGTGASPARVLSWDYDSDGDFDLAVANHGSKSVIVFQNDGAGFFQILDTIEVPLPPVDLATGDVAGSRPDHIGDGRRELLVLAAELAGPGIAGQAPTLLPATGHKLPLPSAAALAQLSSWLMVVGWSQVNNVLEVQQSAPLAGLAHAMTLCNVDTADAASISAGLGQDHDLDLFATRFWEGRVSWLRNFNNRPLNTAWSEIDTLAGASAIAHVDFDRDGDNDLVVANYLANTLTVLFNQGGRETPCGLTDSLGTNVTVIRFGDVPVGQTAVRTFTLSNSSSLSFQFSGTLTDPRHWQMAPASGTLPAGQALPVQLSFTPSDTLFYRATLSIEVNDYLGQDNTCIILLEGRGVLPAISVTDTLLDFGCMPPGGSSVRQLRLENRGNAVLEILRATTGTTYFAPLVEVTGVRIAPHSFTFISLVFRPDRVGEFADTLRIATNDPLRPEIAVRLRGCGSLTGPVITSADTLFATEDVEAVYVARATDPDGTPPSLWFEDLPAWLAAFGDTARGTPREGDLNTYFTVLASDGFYRDTLRVVVIVTPVNDPPEWQVHAGYTVFERELLAFTVLARDPESNSVVLSARDLPAGASFTDQGGGRGAFTWRPPLGSAGRYAVTFLAREQNVAQPLTASVVVEILVLARAPDLFVRELAITPAVVRRNQQARVVAVFGDSLAAAGRPFTAALYLNDIQIADTLLQSLEPGEQFTLSRELVFPQTGAQILAARIDVANAIIETIETNNLRTIRIVVEAGALEVRPNPFTPNGDGLNDEVTFDLRDLGLRQARLRIFDLQGRLLRSFGDARATQFHWNGRDQEGRAQNPGPYLYLLTDDEEKVASGYVILAR